MKKIISQRNAPAALAHHDLNAVAGGYDDGDWCGTRVPGRGPRPVLQLEQLAPLEIGQVLGLH